MANPEMQIVMRISRLDPEDPEGKRRRHFEISIDSPFTVLNCRATQANTALPEYSGPDMPSGYRQQTSCGCPDAEVLASSMSANSSTGTLNGVEPDLVSSSSLPAPPQAAHLHIAAHPVASGANGSRPTSSTDAGAGASAAANALQRVREQEVFQNPRPIHLLRVPSYNPPAFDADVPPPAVVDLMSPPPNYDLIVGTPSVDGLADYFARLADYEESGEGDSSDSGDEHVPTRIASRGGRVNVANPRTPGGRLVPSRSMDIERPVMTLSMAGVTRRGE